MPLKPRTAPRPPADAAAYAQMKPRVRTYVDKFCGGKGSKKPGPCPEGVSLDAQGNPHPGRGKELEEGGEHAEMGQELAGLLGGGHEELGHAAEAAHAAEGAAAHELGSAGKEAVKGEIAGHALEDTDADIEQLSGMGALLLAQSYKPLLVGITNTMKMVPGAKKAGEAIANIHQAATDFTNRATEWMENRYGRATTQAIMGAAAAMSVQALHGVGVPEQAGKLIPAKGFLGAMATVPVLEAGKRLGVIGENTKIDKTAQRVGTWVHAVRAAVEMPMHKAGQALSGAMQRGAFQLGKATGRSIEGAKNLGAALAPNPHRLQFAEAKLSPEQIQQVARRFMLSYMKNYTASVQQHQGDLKDEKALEDAKPAKN